MKDEITAKLVRRETWVTASGIVQSFLMGFEQIPITPETMTIALGLMGVGGVTTVFREKQRKDDRKHTLQHNVERAVEATKQTAPKLTSHFPPMERNAVETGPWGDPPTSQAPEGQQVTRLR